jgi:hypothetical protein
VGDERAEQGHAEDPADLAGSVDGPGGQAGPLRWGGFHDCGGSRRHDDNCYVVCGGAPCPTTVQAEFVQERCRSARSKEVSPILFVHSRVLTPSRWSL